MPLMTAVEGTRVRIYMCWVEPRQSNHRSVTNSVNGDRYSLFQKTMDGRGLTFSGCWVDGDGVVEIDLTGTHFYGDGEALDDFIRALTDDMEAHNSFFGTLHDELEAGGLLVVLLDHAEVEGFEGSFVWVGASTRFPDGENRFYVQIFTESPYFLRASGSVRPTVPTGGCLQKTRWERAFDTGDG